MRATALIDDALVAIFHHLEGENWEALAERLDPDVQLADELTGDWLRGRERVAAYLRAQTGIVTNVKSDLRSGESRWITDDLGLATFVDRARYQLEDVEHRDDLTGSVLFSFERGEWTLVLFHLGAQATVRESHAVADGPTAVAASPASPGHALRDRRTLAGLSLRALGSRVGLSASFLSQVERGQAEPSVNTLLRLAEALEVPAGELLGSVTTAPREVERVVRRKARARVAVPGSGAQLELLTDAATENLEAAIVVLPAGAGPGAVPQVAEPGERLLHVVEGELRLSIGSEHVVLGPGDSFTVPARRPYSLANGADRPLRYITALARSGPRASQSITERRLP